MTDQARLTELTAEITAAFVAHNRVATGEVAEVIASVHRALSRLDAEKALEAIEHVGAVSIRKSLADPAKIISMIDGKPYSMLKRHLSLNGLTPAEYRGRFNLPADYPMTAPGYSEFRRALAVTIGLGRRGKMVETTPSAPRERRKLGLVSPSV
ncbi:MucR family transcriptional regulator [Sphingomonas oligophenolica]|uniref:MucR family transcriptional regulator n=1 Tax=Sphingomonas oligophenolica TaxID=301154 RepID=A0ABU9YAT4_9SPHN